MGPTVNSGLTSTKPCRNIIAIIKVIVAHLISIPALRRKAFKASFWSDIYDLYFTR